MGLWAINLVHSRVPNLFFGQTSTRSWCSSENLKMRGKRYQTWRNKYEGFYVILSVQSRIHTRPMHRTHHWTTTPRLVLSSKTWDRVWRQVHIMLSKNQADARFSVIMRLQRNLLILVKKCVLQQGICRVKYEIWIPPKQDNEMAQTFPKQKTNCTTEPFP